ncbi:anoctamin-7-like isoform X2 [Lytechinus variegatus]|uniref:anoctamin-7-like isoform X2 n=1 Tax=Lytechinus variegatus TaxID=7654 RepID=UPI001BB0E141|nr:anoctamin-7-like isoform X2 [Lytechinus variegatus]XP_041480783.1 anoctamin-7-like isoform X2 [Lytechinus variegatus]
MAASSSSEKNGVAVPMDSYGSTDDTVTLTSKDFLQGDTSSRDPLLTLSTLRNSNDHPGTYFNDGKRKIDFILVHEEERLSEKQLQKREKERSDRRASNLPPNEEDAKEQQHAAWRKKFLETIQRAGLQIEEDVVELEKKIITYHKLHAPWNTLVFFAEELGLKAPLTALLNLPKNTSDQFLKKMGIKNSFLNQNVPNQPPDFMTCAFRVNKIKKYLNNDHKEQFFSNVDRTRVVNEILETTTYGKRKRAEVGISRLLEEEIFHGAFPLHDGPEKAPGPGVKEEDWNKRQILKKYWARWGAWAKYQPLDHIREYFGEKIGLYFAWLGLYTGWLLPASIIGIIVFIYGLIMMPFNPVANQICDSGGDFLMCPQCDKEIGCTYWNLSDTCLEAEISILFDHPGTVFFSIFMSFWAVSFLESWKRKQASLAHHWDCWNFEEEEERPRPQFAAQAPAMEENPITGVMEPYFPEDIKKRRWLTGIFVIVGMVTLVIIFLTGVIMYRVLISIPLSQNELFRSNAQTIASISGAILNLILIMVLGQVYQKLAVIMNDWEMHRTQTEYEDNLTFKVFVFQFMNFFSSIFYIAFFKGKFLGYPGNYNTFFGLRDEACGTGGCLVELAQQLFIIMVGKQIINNCQELAIPKLKQFIIRWKLKGSAFGGSEEEGSRWEEDYQLVPNEGLFEEYLEMIIQFGFITIFVAAFPLAPVFAILNNWLEIRLDAQKFVSELRRPVAERAQDIGVWFDILEIIAQIAVISNAFLIAFTSEFLPKLLYQYQYNFSLDGYVNFTLAYAPLDAPDAPCRYKDFRDMNGEYTRFYWQLLSVKLGFVILFEHFVFGISRFIDFIVPDIPEALEIKIKKEAYMGKQALQEFQNFDG